jgi:hypothetical protein
VAEAAALSWSDTVVAADPDLAAAVAATNVAGLSSPDIAPPALGDAYAADNILTDTPPVPMAPSAAAGLSIGAATANGGGGGGVGATAPFEGTDAAPSLPVVADPGAIAPPPADDPAAAAAAAVTALREQIAGGDPTVDTPAPADTSSSSPPIGYANGAGGVAYDDARVAGFLDGTRKTGQLYVCRAVSNGACASWSFCTASLIGNSLLLTAGHCIFSYGGGAGGWPKTIGGQLQVREDGG